MALQAGVSTSKVLILAGAGLTGSIILRNGKLSEVLGQLHELLKGVDEVEFQPYKYDTTLLAAQIRQLAQEIKELTFSNPVTIYNGNSTSSGGFASYLVPAAALGAMGYCYMWWKGLSFSDVMFVTKQNMANAVSTVSKQLENVSETLASTKRHLSKRLENLDWKVMEQIETSKLIVNNVDEMKTNLSQIGFDVEMIQQMISELDRKLDLLEQKQDATNSGLWYICQVAEGFKDGPGSKLVQGVGDKLANHSTITYEETSLKGLSFLADDKKFDRVDESTELKKTDVDSFSGEKTKVMKTTIHRSYPVGLSTIHRSYPVGLSLARKVVEFPS
ncbi:uncharacterized protein LOC126655614 isoform X2 [Mercurialis annua]|uniref:uncharacterized protein LOC126655614 isoform X2 n=1 Tax=Mercurialis annua TaxID=3986 RepID=UPI0021608499|nr:uncharacterized protein LOC126655614 isoform X2 [Mercurialis annua]